VGEDLVEVAFVGDEFQAEMIRALLEGTGFRASRSRWLPAALNWATA
jgi:hypothetical protein